MTTNIVPMAGLGSRFAQEGYLLPKPLIPVSGKPMIVQAIERMPPANKWVFLVRQEHIEDYRIDKVLREQRPGCTIVPVKELTQGQACTVMLAMPYVDRQDSIYIGACDTAAFFDAHRHRQLKEDQSIDMIVWSMTRQPTLKVRPEKHGWCRLDDDGMTVADMSVKRPVSDDPYNDHASIGAFWFRHAQDFIDAANLMIKQDYRANNEFYVDSLPVFMRQLGKRPVIFDVDTLISWGTPSELHSYEYIEHCLRNGKPTPQVPDVDAAQWKKYFSL